MKNYLFPILALLIVGCGNQRQQQVATHQSIETETTDSTAEHITEEPDIKALSDSTNNIAGGESLNDIRFGSWTDKDWYDNEYFRALRKYLDACYSGEINDDDLEPYRSVMNGKFVVHTAAPFIGGGMQIYFIFLDAPHKVFDAWVYSVIEENRVVDYQIRDLRVCEKDIELTREEILSIVKEHPENKLW